MNLMIEKELNKRLKKCFDIKEKGLIIWLIPVAKKLEEFVFFCLVFFPRSLFISSIYFFYTICVFYCLEKIFNKHYF